MKNEEEIAASAPAASWRPPCSAEIEIEPPGKARIRVRCEGQDLREAAEQALALSDSLSERS